MSELPRLGEVIRQKYRLEAIIGQGGMAVVFAATHLHLQQRVALKLMRPETSRGADVVERFLREARATSRLEGPHVARILDVDTLDDGSPFIVMELLDGVDLSVLLQRQPVSVPEAVGWVREACAAIGEAHAHGIIHRDVKPANLFLARKRTGESVVKVLDFGISKLLEDTRLTADQVGMGSAEYMSPEQMRAAVAVDQRSDVWSLGVTLYELLTRHTPFHADGVGAVVAAVMTATPPPPRVYRPDLPPALEAIILCCLEKDPDRRFARVEDLAAALAPFAGAGAAPPPPGVAAPPSVAATEPARGLPVAAGVAAGLLAVILVIVAFGLGRGRPGEAAATRRFEIVGDAVIDRHQKRTWQRRPAPGAMDQRAARKHCMAQGQRLPGLEELRTLFAVTTLDPPLDPENFGTSPVDVFWSDSDNGDGTAMVARFSTLTTGPSVISARNRVRCVRP